MSFHRLSSYVFIALSCAIGASGQTCGSPATGTPFGSCSSVYLGQQVHAPGWNYNPAAMYEMQNSSAGPFRLWWTCEYDRFNPGFVDYFSPTGGDPSYGSSMHAHDRICTSVSNDGSTWSTPQIVLKGYGGQGVTTDDHLVGSPSVLKLNGVYYMFYERYDSQIATISRFYSPTVQDDWIQSGGIVPPGGDYAFVRALGFAPVYAKANTHPIYQAKMIYTGNKTNTFITSSPLPQQNGSYTFTDQYGYRHLPLNTDPNSNPPAPVPVFWLYDSCSDGSVPNGPCPTGDDRRPIYSCFDLNASNTFASEFQDCERASHPNVNIVGTEGNGTGILGYAIGSPTDLNYADLGANLASYHDMAGSLQNSIGLAISRDGVAWTRVNNVNSSGQGPRGGALLTAAVPMTSAWPGPNMAGCNNGYDLTRRGGAYEPRVTVVHDYIQLLALRRIS